jgi:hypothetical protein
MSEFGDALGGSDRVSLDMHLEHVIARVWRCTWRPRSSKFGDALRGHDQDGLEGHMEISIERDWSCTWRP